MQAAVEEDHEKNKQGKTAFARFKLLSKIESTLRKPVLQDVFLTNQDSCNILSNWLVEMPDRTYPNSKIIMCILQCIDVLDIQSTDREKTSIERAIEMYKDGLAGIGYTEC